MENVKLSTDLIVSKKEALNNFLCDKNTNGNSLANSAKMTDLLSVVQLEGVLVASLVILVKRLAQNLDQRLVLRGGGSHSHKGEQDNLQIEQNVIALASQSAER